MAVSRIKKLRIVAHNSIKDELLDTLQNLGVLHIIKVEDTASHLAQETGAKENLSITVSQIEELIKYLDTIDEKKGVFSGGDKISLKMDEIKDLRDFEEVYEIFLSASSSLKEIKSQRERLIDKKDKLLLWNSLGKTNLKELDLKYASAVFGEIAPKDRLRLIEELNKEKLFYDFELVSQDKGAERLLFVYLKKQALSVEEIFKKNNLNRVHLELNKLSVEDEILYIDDKFKKLEQEELLLNEKLKRLLVYKTKLKCLYVYYYNLRSKVESKENFLNTKEAFLVEGWIREQDIKPTKEAIGKNFSEVELVLDKPKPGETIPVELENKRAVFPFEFVTKVYGLPKYGELDPTPFLAPFFFIFFGFCLTDAGYGLVLALLSLWALVKFKMSRYWKSFFGLLFLGGISALVLGGVTGGWFGNIINILGEKSPKLFSGVVTIKDKLILLDPNKDSIKLLAIALIFGIVQIFMGNLIALYDNFRKKRFLDGILDQGSILVFLTGFTGLVLVMLNLCDHQDLNTLFVRLAQVGAISIVLTAGRENSGIAAKLFNGVFVFYTVISGYISDVLSYSRLWALGLVTGVMAMTCNLIAFMIGDMIPVVGFLVTILILLVGHVFTLAVNVLGSLIHTGRLQFVEFFPKFFKGGGRAFNPLRMQNKYTVVETKN